MDKASDSLGSAVSISDNAIVAGEPGPLLGGGIDAGHAAAYVFVKPATGWKRMTQTAELRASGGVLSDEFGFSVAANGNTVVVGARSATSSGVRKFQGAAYVFVEPAQGWVDMTQTAKLTASDAAYADYLGTSVSVSGNTVVAGASGAGSSAGAAYVFVMPAGGWTNMTETAELTSGISGDLLGYSVANRGNIVVAGAPRWPAYDGKGAAYLFVEPKTGWKSTSKFSAKLTASDGAVNDYFGLSVSISGNTIASGAYGATIGSNSQQGAAYIFAGGDSFNALATNQRTYREEQPGQSEAKKGHPRYKLVDFGTFGGPNSYFIGGVPVLNNNGVVAGYADTPIPDPFPSFCFNPDCYVSHAFQWQNGILTDLGALPGGGSSEPAWVSDTGLVAGVSQNGQIDPLLFGFPELRAVLWQGGGITDLGTLEGGYESLAFSVNDRNQVVGPALNTISDPYCLFAPGFCTTQTRAFLWEHGVMQDLGTLGGPDASAVAINDSGTVIGFSYTSNIPGPTGLPPIDPFLWDNHKMLDLGTLGGTASFPNSFNHHRQVVGQSNLADDVEFHPFLWEHGVMTDLGTFLGPGHPSDGVANSINDSGEAVGWADNRNNDFPALWKDNVTTNLGSVGGDSCAYANSINAKGQVVGRSGLCLGALGDVHAFLWENGGPLVDLNTLVSSGTGVHLTSALFISDQSEIAATGLLANGDQHAFLLIPCGEGDESCEDNARDATTATEGSSTSIAQRLPATIPLNAALGGRGILDRFRGRPFRNPRTLSPGINP